MDSLTKFSCIFYFSYQLLWLLTFSQPTQSLTNCYFPAIFNFGDSNSDTGIQAASERLYDKCGQTFFGKSSGRQSDGRLIIDFMASNLNLPFLNPYLSSSQANYTSGANFATGGATILYFLIENRTYLVQEYQNFDHLVQESGLILKKGIVPKEDYFSQALYVIDIGQNDIAYRWKHRVAVEEINATVPDLVDAIVGHVKTLYSLGARSFWIHNTGPIGCLPYFMNKNPQPPLVEQKDKVGCVTPYNNVAQYFNEKLKESVAGLRVALPLTAITYVDIYSIKYSLFSQPEKYGFSQPFTTCGDAGVSCLPNQTTTIMWDPIHLTEAANKIIYDLILTENFSDPPISPSLACNKLS